MKRALYIGRLLTLAAVVAIFGTAGVLAGMALFGMLERCAYSGVIWPPR